MGMTAILDIWLGPFEYIFVPLTHKGSTWNLASMRQAVLEQKMFGQRTNNGINFWYPYVFMYSLSQL